MSVGLGISGLAASVGIGLVFLTAGWAKVRHRPLLEGVIANYRILPRPLVAPVATVLPYAELAIGAALVGGLGALPALSAIAMLLIFAAGMAVNVRRGRTHIDCGCGASELRQPIGWHMVARNVALAILLAPRLLPAPALSPAEVAAAATGGLALFLCHLLFNALGALSQSSAAAFRRHS